MNKNNTLKTQLVYVINLLLLYILSLSIVIKPSLTNVIPYKLANIEIVNLLIYIIYPFYFYSLFVLLKVKKDIKSIRFIFYITLFLSICVISTNYLLIFIESVKYPNFVYSQYHIYLPYLNSFSNLQVFVTILSIFIYSKKININDVLSAKNIKLLLKNLKKPYLILSIVLIYMVTISIPTYIKLGIYEFSLLNKSFDKNINYKMRTVDLWNIAIKMNYIERLLPTNSIVFIPPQTWDFPEVGNQVLSRYYLYPRTLVSPGKVKEYLEDNKDVCKIFYILLEKGRFKGEYFPEEDIKNVKVTIVDFNGKKYEYNNADYNTKFKNNIKNLEIGIIERNLCK